MSLIENTLEGQINKVDLAIKRLKAFEPPEGYNLCFSGGKDSVCIKRLADMGGVKYHATYNVTSVDPPELVRFIKTFKDVKMLVPKDKEGKSVTMWNLIPKKKMPPTRIQRYCCEKLKETQGKGELNITGVRWAESVNRKNRQALVVVFNKAKILNHDNDENRRMVESCYRTNKTLVNPIIDWSDEDVWEFIKTENIPYCCLYDEGDKRLGCLGCPMSSLERKLKDFERYPKYRDLYIKAFDKMIIEREKANQPNRCGWKNGESVMHWWLYGKEQDLPLFDLAEEIEE